MAKANSTCFLFERIVSCVSGLVRQKTSLAKKINKELNFVSAEKSILQ